MSDAGLSRQARALIWIVAVPFVALSALAAALLVVQVRNGGQQLAFVAIYYAPMALYIWATWSILRTLHIVGREGVRNAVVPAMLRRVRIALFAGAVLTVIGVPLLTWLARGRAYLVTFEPSPIMLGVVGAALIVVAQMLRAGVEARAELQEFF